MEYLPLPERRLDLWSVGIPEEGTVLFVLTENAIEINSARTLLWSGCVSPINYCTQERQQAHNRSVLPGLEQLFLPCYMHTVAVVRDFCHVSPPRSERSCCDLQIRCVG